LETKILKIIYLVKYLGVVAANPEEYIQRYASSLKSADQFPTMIRNIKVQGIYLIIY